MAERCIKGDYIGFTFGGVHSSELGLMRVSNGSRYEQDLLPPLQDKVAQVNGRDGAVYFGSQYNTRPIKVPVAFDNMTEESFNQLKRLLQDKKPKYLWFDETPYKQWLVKAANVQGFKWVCFDESHNGKEKRIYKGEGTLEFSCFSPYAESRFTFLDEEVDSIIYKEGKRLKIGNPPFPFLEEITIEPNGINKIVHIYSEAVLNNNMEDNIFEIPNYGTFDVSSSNNEEVQEEKKKYVKFYNEQGYTTLVEHDAPKVNDTIEDTTDGVNGYRTNFFAEGVQIRTNKYSNDIYNGFKCHIITQQQKLKLLEWIENPGGGATCTLNCKNYGHHYPNVETITFLRTPTIKKGSYINWNFMPISAEPNDVFVMLLVETEEKSLHWVVPSWEENSDEKQAILDASHGDDFKATVTISGIETRGSVKILSPKGFEKKSDNSIQVAKNKLLNFYNYGEWVQSSGLRKQYDVNGNPLYNVYDNNNRLMSVYNAGDIPTDLQLTFSSIPQDQEMTIKLYSQENQDNILGSITLKPIKKIARGDTKLIFDSKLKMFKGADASGTPTGTSYNNYRKEGDFFKLPTKEVLCSENDFLVIEINLELPFEAKYKHHYI